MGSMREGLPAERKAMCRLPEGLEAAATPASAFAPAAQTEAFSFPVTPSSEAQPAAEVFGSWPSFNKKRRVRAPPTG